MSTSLLIRLLAPLAALSLVAAACGGDDDASGTEATETAGDDVAEEPDGAAEADTPTAAPTPTAIPEDFDNTDLTVKPVVLVPDEEPPSALVVTDIVTGEGEAIEAGDYAIMQYVGVAYSTGEQFDASWDRGQPFTFTLGRGEVIEGWDAGIEGMTAGSRRTLVIPPDQAYGETGSGSGSIGPDETLIFTVDLVGFVPGEAAKPEVEVPDAPATELQTTDVVVGEGAAVEEGSIVWVHYVGVAQSDGEQFDASWDRGLEAVVPLQVGVGQVIEGWDEGLLGMQVGGRRELVIPPEMAYGETGAGDGAIAPNETLVFVVDLYAIA